MPTENNRYQGDRGIAQPTGMPDALYWQNRQGASPYRQNRQQAQSMMRLPQNQLGSQSYSRTRGTPSIGSPSTRGPNDGTAGTGMGGPRRGGFGRTWFSQGPELADDTGIFNKSQGQQAMGKKNKMAPGQSTQPASPTAQQAVQQPRPTPRKPIPAPAIPRRTPMMNRRPMMQPFPTPVPQGQQQSPYPVPQMQPAPQVPMFGSTPSPFGQSSYWPMGQMFGQQPMQQGQMR